IKLLRVTVSEIKLFSDFSLNDHTESYITVLTEKGGRVTTVMRGAENRLNTDASISRITAAAREAGEGVAMRVILSQLIDITTFNLAFLTVTEAATAS
ncbi:hypothetical protein BDFG_02278, partial [Blastomyces dermatitidis ATCC 26199]